MSMQHDFLRSALVSPEATLTLALADWDVLIRQARSADLLARLASHIRDAGMLEAVPDQARMHLRSSLVVAEAQHSAVRREVEHVRLTLNAAGVEPVLLKGGAYVMAGLPAAQGRLFSDLDILVPHARLAEAEAALMLSGWASSHHDSYDQRYYRKWMHELPPMLHIRRLTVLDVHHAIVPATADLKPDSIALLDAALPLADCPGVRILAPSDMVLHSATHLFYNEEFSHALRDMSDLDLLLRHFMQAPAFWDQLLARAQALGLMRPLYYCLRYCAHLFATPIPEHVLAVVSVHGWMNRFMDQLWRRVLTAPHASARAPYAGLASQLLYLRAHWHRMPPHLLAYHLCVKLLRPNKAAAA